MRIEKLSERHLRITDGNGNRFEFYMMPEGKTYEYRQLMRAGNSSVSYINKEQVEAVILGIIAKGLRLADFFSMQQTLELAF